ncbi:glutamate racemase [hot springs metagenome]|uniref:glutamate racemase n=1 Tax=hot springs metagenome TaxID=433727 RepID=A0A5J4L2H9_9ZZZZ
MNNEPIGIFDSGVGGLTVLKELRRILPYEDIIYLGDTARVPYGIRSPETVTRYSFECTEFLLSKKIKLLVVACNTVSAISLKEIQKKVSIPVVGVIEPGARAAVDSTKNGKIGIIGTEATIKSSAYFKAIKAISEDLEVFGLACPLFVPLVEEGWTNGIIVRLIVEEYLKSMLEIAVDTLVLGCTHYPLLKGVIQDVMKDVSLVDSAIETAKVVRKVLEEQGVNSNEQGVREQGRLKFYVTDSTDKFVSIGERFLQSKIEDIEKINLGR